LIRIKPDEARRIAANIAKPELRWRILLEWRERRTGEFMASVVRPLIAPAFRRFAVSSEDLEK
jgi:hypothetical protein